MKLDINLKEIEDKIKSCKLNNNDLSKLKDIFKKNKKYFVYLINLLFNSIKNEDNFDFIIEFIDLFFDEINEISPFLSKSINNLFFFLFQKKVYTYISKLSEIFINCGNKKILNTLEDFLKNKNEVKFVSSKDIYKIKKIIFELNRKLNINHDISISINIKIKDEDLEWKDRV